MRFRRRRSPELPEASPELLEEISGRKKKDRNRKEKNREKVHKSSADPELAARLREYGENYGLEEDPYLEGLSNAIEEGKNLAVWASNDVMTLMPHPDVESVEGPIYSAMVLIRNVLVFVPVALTWLAVGKATTGFAVYTAKSSAASVVNFLQFWQNGYGVLAKVWTLSHIAEDDFYIIGTVILLTFITPFMNRSAVKKAASFEQDALRERLTLVIEVESFLFDKRRLTPLSIDSALAQSFERVVEATHNLAMASKRIEVGLHSPPREIEGESSSISAERRFATPFDPLHENGYKTFAEEIPSNGHSNGHSNGDGHKKKSKSSSDLVVLKEHPDFAPRAEFDARDTKSVRAAADSLEAVSKRVDVIAQSLPRRAHARKELKKIEDELSRTRTELMELQERLKKQQKKAQKQGEWKVAKREAERNKALGRSKNLSNGAPSYLEGE